jgi:hypothetical protein
MVVSKFCKAINFCNSACTLYALLKRSGCLITSFIFLDHHTTEALAQEEAGAGGRKQALKQAGSVDQKIYW